jgi:hypothetical protein
MKRAWLAIAIAALVLVLVGIGELHRHDCVQEHQSGCSILLWSGHYQVWQAGDGSWQRSDGAVWSPNCHNDYYTYCSGWVRKPPTPASGDGRWIPSSGG